MTDVESAYRASIVATLRHDFEEADRLRELFRSIIEADIAERKRRNLARRRELEAGQ